MCSLKSARSYFCMVLAAITFLFSAIFTSQAYAQDRPYDASKVTGFIQVSDDEARSQHENPFPDKLSPSFIDEFIASQDHAVTPKPSVTKIYGEFFDGHEEELNPIRVSNHVLRQLKAIHAYSAIFGENDSNNYVIKNIIESAWILGSFAHEYMPQTNHNGIALQGGLTNDKRPYIGTTRVEINGRLAMQTLNGKTFESSGHPAIEFPHILHRQYVHCTVELDPKQTNVISQKILPRFTCVYSKGSRAAFAGIAIMFGYDNVTGYFHFVNDAEYRSIKHIAFSNRLPERNAGLPIYGNGAAKALDLKDIVAPKTTVALFDDQDVSDDPNRIVYVPKSTILAPEPVEGVYPHTGSQKSFYNSPDASYYEFDLNTNSLSDTLRPTFKDVKDLMKSHRDWVYIDNDIDWPNETDRQNESITVNSRSNTKDSEKIKDSVYARSNAILAPSFDENGSVVRERHYYLTYRKLPTPVKIIKSDADGHNLAGAEFTLNRLEKAADGSTLTYEVAKNLRTDENGSILLGKALTHQQAEALVKDPKNLIDGVSGVYRQNDNLYLTAGAYELIETKAPSGYQPLNEPVKFTVNDPQYTDDETFTPKFEELSVVNTKKDLPPAPQPKPDPSPKPNPQPVPDPSPTPDPQPKPYPSPRPNPDTPVVKGDKRLPRTGDTSGLNAQIALCACAVGILIVSVAFTRRS